jgi:hypothetical protein
MGAGVAATGRGAGTAGVASMGARVATAGCGAGAAALGTAGPGMGRQLSLASCCFSIGPQSGDACQRHKDEYDFSIQYPNVCEFGAFNDRFNSLCMCIPFFDVSFSFLPRRVFELYASVCEVLSLSYSVLCRLLGE